MKETTYFDRRMAEMNISEENNKVKLIDYRDRVLYDEKVFSPNEHGDIEILLYNLDREPIVYAKKGANSRSEINPIKYDFITRYSPEREKQFGRKYHISGKTGTHPFLHPTLLDKFHGNETIETLVLTEGAFKSFVACENGIMTVGFSSITHYKDKRRKTLHSDVLRLIQACQVKNVIVLWDGDALDISDKDIKSLNNIEKRPTIFYSTIVRIYDLLSEHRSNGLNLFFMHPKSAEIMGNPKGIDDLLLTHKSDAQNIKQDIHKLFEHSPYFEKISLNTGIKDLKKYFAIDDVDKLYLRNAKKIGKKEFKFKGGLYEYDDLKKKVVIKVHADTQNFFRVGDNYYERIAVPDMCGNLQKKFVSRQKTTITDDYGRAFLKDVEKYKAFTNVPDHKNHKPVINGCFNTYHEIPHKAKDEVEVKASFQLMKHIFIGQIDHGVVNLYCSIRECTFKVTF